MELKKPQIKEEEINNLIVNASLALEQSIKNSKSNAKYGAAVLSINKEIYKGFNIFSSSQTLSIHAEQCAIINAYINDDKTIKAIAVSSDDESTEPIPCGICRQLLFENARYSGLDIVILTSFNGKLLGKYYLSELYPKPWPNREFKNLKND